MTTQAGTRRPINVATARCLRAANRLASTLGSRIIAACSAFAAMTPDRPYARRGSMSATLDELARAAGSQFDSAVVDALRLGAHDLVP
jgi:hypothetical protein